LSGSLRHFLSPNLAWFSWIASFSTATPVIVSRFLCRDYTCFCEVHWGACLTSCKRTRGGSAQWSPTARSIQRKSKVGVPLRTTATRVAWSLRLCPACGKERQTCGVIPDCRRGKSGGLQTLPPRTNNSCSNSNHERLRVPRPQCSLRSRHTCPRSIAPKSESFASKSFRHSDITLVFKTTVCGIHQGWPRQLA
jgi:hypothetical protein